MAALLQELVDGATGEGASTLGYKEPGQLALTLSKVTPEKPQFVTGNRVHSVDPVLGSLHEYRSLIQVQLLKLDVAELWVCRHKGTKPTTGIWVAI